MNRRQALWFVAFVAVAARVDPLVASPLLLASAWYGARKGAHR